MWLITIRSAVQARLETGCFLRAWEAFLNYVKGPAVIVERGSGSGELCKMSFSSSVDRVGTPARPIVEHELYGLIAQLVRAYG